MRHCYKNIVAYNPVQHVVSACTLVPIDDIFNSKALDEAFYRVYEDEAVDKTTDMIIGITITGDTYQLSRAAYGTYIKEDDKSIEFINRSKLFVALDKFKIDNNIPFT